MVSKQTTQYEEVDASPVKSFFVSMLTRDIKLEEAILDLLDNCVDGILRSGVQKGAKPYEGFEASIDFTSETFSISDNCGGIPWDLHERAFRMGRPPQRDQDGQEDQDGRGSVGVYGIGMKRAIFKMGKHCLISTRNVDDQYEVEITPDWIDDETRWKIPVRPSSTPLGSSGTTIVVGNLYISISKTFDENEGGKSFHTDLDRMVSSHYAYIMEKGFQVTINGMLVKPRTTKIVYDKRRNAGADAIRPFVFRSKTDGVDVYLAVGFTRPIPSESEIVEEQEASRYSSIDAGWTILCNDRAVLHCDRTELTGWGEARVPRYHTQFIAISGIVEFKCEDPSKLPTTTTKRGIDASSPLYLQVKNKMREGMRVFTDYTNKWKGQADESKRHIQRGVGLSLEELKETAAGLAFSNTRTLPPGSQYKPRLPMPPRVEPTKRRITFVKEVARIKAVAEYFDDPDMQPSEVGESCFDLIYRETRG